MPGWCLADARCGWARTITYRMSPGHQAAAWGSVQKVVEESARKEEELRRSLQQARDDGLRGASHARVQQEVRVHPTPFCWSNACLNWANTRQSMATVGRASRFDWLRHRSHWPPHPLQEALAGQAQELAQARGQLATARAELGEAHERIESVESELGGAVHSLRADLRTAESTIASLTVPQRYISIRAPPRPAGLCHSLSSRARGLTCTSGSGVASNRPHGFLCLVCAVRRVVCARWIWSG